jgi:hypothetical protein
MRLGFKLFVAFAALPTVQVYEVFPSASYAQLFNASELSISLNLSHFAPGPKDMLDACIGGVTVCEFFSRRGVEVGGGDGLGTIVLPRPVRYASPDLENWPR